MKVGDHVYHRKYGRGTLLELPADRNALVKWDTHRVARQTDVLSTDTSHVSPKSLALVSGIPAWSLDRGQVILRKELHARFGGSKQGGVSPSAKTPNILIFTDPKVGEQHGYRDQFDEASGTLFYTGEGQRGDQRFLGGNRAIRDHRETGQSLRVFEGSSGQVRYLGEFAIDEAAPYSFRDAPSTGGGPIRSVIVFKLQSLASASSGTRAVGQLPARNEVTQVDIEEQNTERAFVEGAKEGYAIERREAKLVRAFTAHLFGQGHKSVRQLIKPQYSTERLFTDVYVPTLNLLVEAKGSTSRDSVRAALGQLLDYRRYLREPTCAILLPSEPRPDLVDLALTNGVHMYWALDNGKFEHRSP